MMSELKFVELQTLLQGRIDDVLIKQLSATPTATDRSTFLRQLDFLLELDSEYIVNVIAFVRKTDPNMIVLEYIGGNLRDHLRLV